MMEFILNKKDNEYEIILVGDSAGGCLISCLTNWIILNDLKKPKSMLMIYPCVDLMINKFTPSMLKGFEDLLINFEVFKLI